MAYDIGPKIGIDGEAEFRKAITSINDNVKNLGSEMKLVAAIYDENADSMEALTAKNELLQKTYDEQEKKVSEVTKMLERIRGEYGDNEEAVRKWERVLTESKTALQKTQNEMDKNLKAIEKLEGGADDLTDAFDGVDEALEDVEKAVKDLGDSTEKTSGKFDAFKVAAGNLISGGVSALASGVAGAVSAFANLDEATEEYRVAMGKLNAAFEAGGGAMDSSIVAHGKFEAVLMDTGEAVDESWHTAEKAAEVYKGLYAVLGDTDTAVEAAQLMVQLADGEEDFAQWTRIAAGVAGTFGDALPINSLIEAANETVKVGEVTGALADALNWAGISEDEFNEKLAACTSESERNDLIMGTLTDTYNDAADAFYRNNEQLIKSRENQAKLDEITGRLGETVSDVKNTMMEKFGPAIIEIGEDIAKFIEGVDTDELFEKFDTAWDNIKGVWDLAEPYFVEVSGLIGGAFDTLDEVLKGDFDSAWSSAKGVFSDTWDFFTGVGEDIINAMAGGIARARRENTDFGQDADRVGAYGTASGSGDVYLDGKKVGKVLGASSELSMIADGTDVSLFP